MRLDAGEVLSIQKSRIIVKGLAKLGRLDPKMIDGPGSFSTPPHRVPGVYAGTATHGVRGNELTSSLPVLLLCNNEEQTIYIVSNSITGAFLAIEKYELVTIQSVQADSLEAA